ncbi:putative E3 ubiquitin-protein ligase UNKL isoform X3 [Rhinolophus sinicus]|uniref:putative E3 ubiquitin-protein ligase UNKL isoform X3 n=1 Tax=Rhinolophus sinicus TaxID=89399 RepID=UPI003D796959
MYQQRSGSGGGGALGVCPWRGRVWGPRGARRALTSCLVLAGRRSPEAPAGGVARAGRVGVAGRARGAGGLREGGDPEGRGRARAAHARCIVLTENAVGFESGGGGAERVPPADGEADPLQRRRRPLRRRDGTFNYSPDVYCSKYDEASGVCPDGDECPYLHRTTGDTERKYHLRYYKTGTCIHETDARGHCVKNGLHCAFAHGPLDLRPPVCDIRELQAQEALQNGQLGGGGGIPELQPGVLASQAMIEKILGDDPRWQDTNFVLGSYKTEQCPKPPRLCRQGYACPHYHNSRDRRRNPRRFQYRSTPCPSVKHGDEWGEPSRCESGDSCQYCHSRTEQQFHPEIYKSTKCNDMRQTGYCPRGPFCAFAHVEKSLGMANDWGCRDLTSASSSSANSSQPGNAKRRDSPAEGSQKASEHGSKQNHLAVFAVVHPLAPSVSSSVASSLASSAGSGGSSPTALPALSARAHPLDPTGSALESIPGSALDLHLSDVSLTPLDKELDEQDGSDLGPTGLNGVPGSIWDFVSGSFSPSPSPILNAGPASSASASPNSAELARVRRQLDEAKRKIRQWEESWQQVKEACDAWQREAKEAKERALAADSARQLALQKKEEVEAQFRQLQEELEGRGVSALPGLQGCSDLGAIPLPKLHSLQSQLRLDLEAVDGVIFQLRAKQCVVCGERARGAVLRPCQHRVLCEPCAAGAPECPYCEGQPLQW